MFGYVRPDAPELKIKEFERFKACYCGLCHQLGDEYGIVSRFFLNYDFVFLAMLLWNGDGAEYCFRRCAPAFFRKRCVSHSCQALSVSAGFSVILTYWKIYDSVLDECWYKAIISRFLKCLMRKAYKKAAGKYPSFDQAVRFNLSELWDLEKNGESSIDKCADKFASILSAASAAQEDNGVRRARDQLLYHVGRIVYIADAYHDLADDMNVKKRRFNPIVSRFHLTSPKVPEDVSQSVLQTLRASLYMIFTAYELIPRNYWSPILDNIIYLGLPDMCEKVIAGKYQITHRKIRKNKSFTDMLPERSENEK